MAFRSSQCVFIGYNTFHKGYRCLHPSGRIYIARSVTFNETEFPYQQLFTNSVPPTTSSQTHYLNSADYQLPHPYMSRSTPIEPHMPSDQPLPSNPQTQIQLTSTPTPNPTSDSHVALNIPIPVSNSHAMRTRSKAGISKPKMYVAHVSSSQEPVTVKQALASPQ